ncbi:MAG: hypothetical protein IKC48_00090 [Clostridia bacterium]|nr:hypothetical protein [Clostridia bacterium]
MDYGKLAYLKAVDLEDRLGKKEKNNFTVSVLTYSDLVAGKNTIANLQGEGDIGVMIQSSGSASFFVDDAKVCEGTSVFFRINGSGTVSVESSNAIQGLRFMAFGNMIACEHSCVSYADYNDTHISYVICDQGRVRAYITPIGKPDERLVFDEAFVQADVASYEEGFLYTLLDENGRIKIVLPNGQTRYLDFGVERVSVCTYGGRLIVAYVKKGKLYYQAVSAIDQLYGEYYRVHYAGYVDDVRLVKKSGWILFSSGGKCYAKELESRIEGRDKISISMEVIN